MTGLLLRSTKQRLGCRSRRWKDVLEHEFFSDFNFEKLLRGEVQVPHLPTPEAREPGTADSDGSGLSDIDLDDDSDEDLSDNDGWDKDFCGAPRQSSSRPHT
eukprot:NODE_26045_length_566_cov_11.070615.p3 GENE.NODE_26045_length_566_cov_11.070615~~NODE_26045_length_566_cov_11.070615.p3  ORF type:complete len:102 (-),score=16.79 NODE_26045_length_566_cov_11.070615:259-564(-)